MLNDDSLYLQRALQRLKQEFANLPALQTTPDADPKLDEVLAEVASRLGDNLPYFHPLYAGQMLKPPHPVARLAYCLAMWINPNNHALDGGRASSAMEKQAVAEIAAMFDWPQHLGHLTSGGTMANLEALWIAGELHPDKKILASAQAHYTHSRISKVLKLKFQTVPVNAFGQMDVQQLKAQLAVGDVGTVVATLGTTGLGAVDPLAEILALRKDYDFRVHVDAAYGGYFILADNLDASTKRAYAELHAVDSIVIDPHKHGLQPYGCGCVLFRDPAVGRFYKHDSPYTYFSSNELHLGEISLECSRAGAAAVALWATQKLLPLHKKGEFANLLAACHATALRLYEWLNAESNYLTLFPPQLDIVIFAPKAATVTALSAQSRRLFETAAAQNLHLALIELPSEIVKPHWPEITFDAPQVTCLRSCLMKPEHADWLQQITARLAALIEIV